MLKKKSHSLNQEKSNRGPRKYTKDSIEYPRIFVNQKSIFEPTNCECSASRDPPKPSESSICSEFSYNKSEHKREQDASSESSGQRTLVSSRKRFKGDFHAKLNESQTKLKNLKLNLNLKKHAKEKTPETETQDKSIFKNMLSKMFKFMKINSQETTDSETSFHSKTISSKSDFSIFSEKGESSFPVESVRRVPFQRRRLPSRVKMIRKKLKMVLDNSRRPLQFRRIYPRHRPNPNIFSSNLHQYLLFL